MRRELMISTFLLFYFLFFGTSCIHKSSLAPPHPIFKQKEWVQFDKKESLLRDPNGLDVLWRRSVFYEHRTEKEIFKKSEHRYFGKQLALKEYGVRDAKGNTLKQWVSIRDKNGRWKVFETGCKDSGCYGFRFFVVRDTNKFVIGVNLIIESMNGTMVFRRFVERKDFKWINEK